MIMRNILLIFASLGLVLAAIVFFSADKVSQEDVFLSYTVDCRKQDVQFYWGDENGIPFRSIQNLRNWVQAKQKKLVFAMNGGMYNPDNTPKGLYIHQFKEHTPLDTTSGEGNFYLKPNGVFYLLASNIPVICNTENFRDNRNVKFATQSGPLLLINGEINTAFKQGSANLQIRNGVGVLSDQRVVFVMSKTEVNFYDFANYFKSIGCKNALYLDGFVSRTYLPEKNWQQIDGNFGVIIGVTI